MARFRDALDFYRHGSRDAFAAVAADPEQWQPLSVSCGGCGTRYLATVARRRPSDDGTAVGAYPDVMGQTLLVTRALTRECPDHAYRIRVNAFTVVA